MSLHPKYFNKMSPPEVRYICPRCLKVRPDLGVHGLAYYMNATCCVCGKTGTQQRLTSASSERVSTNALQSE